MKRWLLIAALASLWAWPALAGGTFTIIEDLPNSFFPNAPFLSDDGTVMSGFGFNGVFYWTEAGGVVWIDDGTVSPQGGKCSGDGQSLAVTYANLDGLNQAGYWSDAGGYGFMDLIPEGAPCGADLSTAYDLNYDGSIGVGLAWIGCDARAFKWVQGVGAVNLGSSGNSSRATAISTDGMVTVGFDEHPSAGYRRPAIWTDDVTGPQLIAGEDAAGECYNASSDGAMVVGQIDGMAMYYDELVGAVNIGTLPGDEGFGALALDVSEDGKVVGYSGNPFFSIPRAFIWDVVNGMMPLTDYLIAEGVTGWEDYGIFSATAISDDGLTIAGTYEDPSVFPPYGTYIIQLEGSVSIEGGDGPQPAELPSALRLDGAFPNPFNPMTAIKFSTNRDQRVTLSVVNMAGRRVATLADRAFAAGDHQVTWQGTDEFGRAVPSGTYLIKLESEDGVRTDKMMLVR
jgi:uncharacterized membrane protein